MRNDTSAAKRRKNAAQIAIRILASLVILSEGARFAFRIALRSRRTPWPPAPPQAQKGIRWSQWEGAESSWPAHQSRSERNGCPISGRSCRKWGFRSSLIAPQTRASAAMRNDNVSREAAKECSPRRKPWGSATKPKQAQEGRKRLIPDVALVISHVVLLEERKELFLKRVFLVMLFLPGNIFRDRRNIRFAHAEHTVAGLPCEL